jgi:hypothetical protein
MNTRNSDTISRTSADNSQSSERRTNSYKSMQQYNMHQYNMNPKIQTNIDQCMDPYIHPGAETEMNVVRPFIYTVLIFLALCAVSYLFAA